MFDLKRRHTGKRHFRFQKLSVRFKARSHRKTSLRISKPSFSTGSDALPETDELVQPSGADIFAFLRRIMVLSCGGKLVFAFLYIFVIFEIFFSSFVRNRVAATIKIGYVSRIVSEFDSSVVRDREYKSDPTNPRNIIRARDNGAPAASSRPTDNGCEHEIYRETFFAGPPALVEAPRPGKETRRCGRRRSLANTRRLHGIHPRSTTLRFIAGNYCCSLQIHPELQIPHAICQTVPAELSISSKKKLFFYV